MKNFSECGDTNYIYFHDSLFYNIAGYRVVIILYVFYLILMCSYMKWPSDISNYWSLPTTILHEIVVATDVSKVT